MYNLFLVFIYLTHLAYIICTVLVNYKRVPGVRGTSRRFQIRPQNSSSSMTLFSYLSYSLLISLHKNKENAKMDKNTATKLAKSSNWEKWKFCNFTCSDIGLISLNINCIKIKKLSASSV